MATSNSECIDTPCFTQAVFQVSPDITYYNREVYGLLDFLIEVGGLGFALKIIAKVFIYLMTGDSMTRYLTGKLFKKQMFVKGNSQEMDPTSNAKKTIGNRANIKSEACAKSSNRAIYKKGQQRLE